MNQHTRYQVHSFAQPGTWRWVVGLAVAALLSATVSAATVLETSIDEMLSKSALVIEGEVIDIGPATGQATDDSRYPWTAVTVRITDTIKRAPGVALRADGTIVLNFLGGQRNGKILRVPGMTLPALGEQGVFFVEAPSELYPHPLSGWSQGQFSFRQDDAGVDRVVSARGNPVTGVSRSVGRAVKAISRGVARGVSMSDTMQSGLQPYQFKQQLRELLRKGAAQ